MTILELLPAWLLALVAFLSAGALLLRLRADQRRLVRVALFPALVWLGTTYLFIEFNIFGLSDATLRAAAVRPALLLILLALLVSDLTALWRLRRHK